MQSTLLDPKLGHCTNDRSWFCPSRTTELVLVPVLLSSLLTPASQVLLSFGLKQAAFDRQRIPKILWSATCLSTHWNAFHTYGVQASNLIRILCTWLVHETPFLPLLLYFVFSLKPWLNPTVSSFSGDAEGFSNQLPTCPDSRSNSTERYTNGHKTNLFPGRIGNAWRSVFLRIYLTSLAGPRPCPQIFARSPRVNLPKWQLTGGTSWNPCGKTSGSINL